MLNPLLVLQTPTYFPLLFGAREFILIRCLVRPGACHLICVKLYEVFVTSMETFSSFMKVFFLLLQARLLRGASFVHETYGGYRSLEELWDGEI